MLRFLRSHLAFFAAVLIISIGPVLCLINTWQIEAAEAPGIISITTGLCSALAAALLLGGGVYYTRRRGGRALLPPARLWGLLALAVACICTGHLYAFADWRPLPLSLFLTMGSLCLTWGLLGRYALVFWWPYFILELAQIAGYLEYGSRINSLVLAETFEASGEEALAYLTTGNICIALAATLGSTLLCRLMARLLRGQARLTLLNTAMLWLALTGLLASLLPGRYQKPEYFWPVAETYLLQQACSEAIFHNQATIEQAESLPSPTLQPSSLHTLKGGEGVVLVLHIGESVRADRMSLNGYERDTTPWLRRQSRLINFPHCISAACDTCQAQIAILTDARRDIYETDPAMQPHTGSVLDLFEAHGFRLYSFFGKRNATHLKYDLVVRLLTRRSAERFHAPGSPWTAVPQMADVLRRTGDKQNTLLFINNEGSHTPFYHYDHENPPFTPIGSNFAYPSSHAQEVNNAYDATVLYTDEFVHRVVRLLQGRPWVYIYISDHGEYLGHDGIWGRAGLGESKRSYHSTSGSRVGMFILSSPEFEQLHPHFAAALQQLQAHSSLLVGQEHIFHTLLGLFDLRTPHYNPALDLTTPTVQPYSGPAPAEACPAE